MTASFGKLLIKIINFLQGQTGSQEPAKAAAQAASGAQGGGEGHQAVGTSNGRTQVLSLRCSIESANFG